MSKLLTKVAAFSAITAVIAGGFTLNLISPLDDVWAKMISVAIWAGLSVWATWAVFGGFAVLSGCTMFAVLGGCGFGAFALLAGVLSWGGVLFAVLAGASVAALAWFGVLAGTGAAVIIWSAWCVADEATERYYARTGE